VSTLIEPKLVLMNNEKVEITYIGLTVQNGEEMRRFYLLSKTVLLRQIWDCLVQDGEQNISSSVNLNRGNISIIE
jgi:hypothetical protein